MNRIRVLALLASSLLACSSDTPAVTQIVITVDSNLKVPEEIDRITIDVRGLVQTQHAAADLTEHDLPRHLTLVHDDGPLGPIRVTTTGWIGQQIKVVEYTTDVSFSTHETVALNIDLDRACRNYFCDEDPDKTCKAGRCEPIEEPQEPIDAGGTPDVDSGPSPKPDAGTTKDAGPTPIDAGKPDAGPKNQAPKCTVMSPSPGQTFTTTEMVLLEGACFDPESGDLPDKALRWSSDDGALGLGAQITLPPQPAGAQTFMLCASDPKDSTLTDCDEVSITIMVPTPPTAMITDVREGADKESPFLPTGKVQFTGEGTGEEITYTWTDSFVGEFGSKATVSLSEPEVGRHRVTLTVTDDIGQAQEDNVTFQVLEVGQTSLVQPFENVNTTLTDGASVLAADSTGQVLAASGTTLYRFDANSESASAASGFTDASLITLTAINAITIWEPASLVYLGTTTGLVVCPYTAGTSIDATMCMLYQGGDFPSNQITSVARATVDSIDWLLIGTTNGLFIPDDLKGATTGANTLFKDEAVNGIVESGGLFWFTSADSGLLYYDPARDRIRSAANGLEGPSLQLSAVAADESGAIWVGSSKGVGRYDPDAKTWQVWATGDAPAPGLPSDKVSALATTHATLGGDPHDMVWIGTDAGVSRLDADVPSFMTLDDADSLPSDKVLAIAVLSDGSKVFATDVGVSLYVGR